MYHVWRQNVKTNVSYVITSWGHWKQLQRRKFHVRIDLNKRSKMHVWVGCTLIMRISFFRQPTRQHQRRQHGFALNCETLRLWNPAGLYLLHKIVKQPVFASHQPRYTRHGAIISHLNWRMRAYKPSSHAAAQLCQVRTAKKWARTQNQFNCHICAAMLTICQSEHSWQVQSCSH